MTLAEIYCPPIPTHWLEAVPYVVVKELGSPDPDEIEGPLLGRPPKPEYELTQLQKNKRDYQRVYSALNRKKLSAQKREWYLRTGRAKRKTRYELEKARTETATGTAKSPLRDDFQEVEGMHTETGVW